jgi:O-antigen/teichoic acid export membrane protein
MFSHILIYVPAKLVPAALALLTLGIFTRVLTVEQYGYFALASSLAFMLDGFLGQWLMAAIMRFHARQAAPADLERLLASCGLLYVVPALLACLLIMASLLIWLPPGPELACLLLAAPYFFLYSLAQLVLRVRMAALDSFGYARLLLTQSFAGATMSIALVVMVSPEPALVLVGLSFGFGVVLLLDRHTAASLLALTRADRSSVKEIFRFSWSGIIAGGLSMLGSRLNRFLVLAYLGSGAVGLLNAAQSLTEQALSAVFMIVAMAAHPMTVRAQDTKPAEALQDQLRSNAIWTVGLGLPSAVGFALLAPELAAFLLGPGYRDTDRLIPWIAAAAALNGLRSHFVVHSYFLASKLHYNLYLAGVLLAAMLVLNGLLIPLYGIFGAILALLATELAATGFAIWLTLFATRMPAPLSEFGRILLAAGIMAAAILAIPGVASPLALAAKLAVGGSAYLAAALMLNVNGSRHRLGCLIKSQLAHPS